MIITRKTLKILPLRARQAAYLYSMTLAQPGFALKPAPLAKQIKIIHSGINE